MVSLSAAMILLSWSGEHFLIINDIPQKKEVILVLGYPAQEDGTPSPIMKSRVEKGVSLFQKGYAQHIIFSGAAVRNRFVEADVMAGYARVLGVPDEAVLLEKKAENTRENIQYSWLLMSNKGWDGVIVVTTPYHTRRAAYMFSAYPVNVSFSVAELPAAYTWFHNVARIVYEYAALVYYVIYAFF